MLKKLIIFLSGIYSCAAFSAENANLLTWSNNFLSYLDSSLVVTLSAGPAWESAGQSQTLALAPEIEKTYTADRPNNVIGNYDLFLGIQKSLSEKFLGQIGLDVSTTNGARLSGDVWDDADPLFDNYTYQYRVKHTQVAVKGKLLGSFGWPVMPWVSLAVGAGFNRSYDFTNSPLFYESVVTPNFASRTVKGFTYAVGIGVQRVVAKNWQLGVGYEFADWGRSSLGTVAGSTTNQTLGLAHLYTQAVMVNISYVAS